MNLIKVLLGVAIIIFFGFCGYLLARKYRKRKLFFEQFQIFNERFLGEVTYCRRPILEFLTKFTYKGEFALLLADYMRAIGGERINLGEFLQYSDYDFLKTEDKAFLNDYLSMLGRSDSTSQKSYISSAGHEIEARKNDAQSEYKKRGDLYLKLGLLLGLFILILLI